MISAHLVPIIVADQVANVAEVGTAVGLCRIAEGDRSPNSEALSRDWNAEGRFGIPSLENLAQPLEAYKGQ